MTWRFEETHSEDWQFCIHFSSESFTFMHSSCVAMLLGAWSICYQLGSGSRWCTSTLLISSESRFVMSSSSQTFTQTFFGACYNDDSKYGLFMTKVTGVRLGKKVMWQQLIPTQWSYDVEPLLFQGYLNTYNDAINGGRIYTLTGEEKCQGVFNGRLFLYDIGKLLPELPPGIVAATVQCGCIWYWSLVPRVHGGADLTCWSFVPTCCDSDDTQTIREKDNHGTAGVRRRSALDGKIS